MKDSPGTQPSKPSKPTGAEGSEGFVGPGPSQSSIIRTEFECTRQTDPAMVARPVGRDPLTYLEWKAKELNALFEAHGATGEPGKVTVATVRHGWRPLGRV
jgi:hypothetical protein